jgi:proline iminopeptidase
MRKSYFFDTLLGLCITTFAFAQNHLSKGEHFANINGIRIHYYVNGKGPVCLFPSPGWGPSIEGSRKMLAPLEKYFTMVWYDTRLSGKSTGPTDPTKYASEDLMDDMEGLRIYLKQSKIWVAGHSAAGFQVLYYGIHHTDKLMGLIAISAMAGNDSISSEEKRTTLMKREGQPYFPKGINVLMGKDTARRSRQEVFSLIAPFYFHDQKNTPKFFEIAGTINQELYQYSRESRFSTENIFSQLNEIKVPALVVGGDDDFISGVISQTHRIHQKILNSYEVVIKGAGHFPFIEDPNDFFLKMNYWLKSQKLEEHK